MSDRGVDAALELEISPHAVATLAIDGLPAQRISDLQLRGPALIGTTVGSIAAADAERNQARKLHLELLPYNGSLVGRILAIASSPGRLAGIPFTVTLERAPT